MKRNNGERGMRKKIIPIMIAVLIVTIMLLSGCSTRKNTNQPASILTGWKTCAELNGYVCNESQECNGTWVNASDTFRCCSCECQNLVNESGILMTDTFDEDSMNDSLGDIQ